MRFRSTLAAAAIVAVGGAAAVPALAATKKTVAVKDFKFTPKTLTVKKGTRVTWKFGDSALHDVTVTKGPVKFHSKSLASGKSYAKTLKKAGTYSIICSIHPFMKETLKVK